MKLEKYLLKEVIGELDIIDTDTEVLNKDEYQRLENEWMGDVHIDIDGELLEDLINNTLDKHDFLFTGGLVTLSLDEYNDAILNISFDTNMMVEFTDMDLSKSEWYDTLVKYDKHTRRNRINSSIHRLCSIIQDKNPDLMLTMNPENMAIDLDINKAIEAGKEGDVLKLSVILSKFEFTQSIVNDTTLEFSIEESFNVWGITDRAPYIVIESAITRLGEKNMFSLIHENDINNLWKVIVQK